MGSKKSVIPAKRQGVTHEVTAATTKQVESMAAVGVTQVQIATLLGISDETFRKYYGEIFNRAKVQAVGMVASTLFKRATEGKDLAAAIFYLKAQGGWRETPSLQDLGNVFNIHIHT
jgi:DNA-binding NarL/FixJ family response regulator